MATKEIAIKFLAVEIDRVPNEDRYYWRLVGVSGEDRIQIESLSTFDSRYKV